MPTTRGVAMSLDGREWFLEPQLIQLRAQPPCLQKGAHLCKPRLALPSPTRLPSRPRSSTPLLQAYMPAASGNPIPYPQLHQGAVMTTLYYYDLFGWLTTTPWKAAAPPPSPGANAHPQSQLDGRCMGAARIHRAPSA